ncbi:MAG: tetratricopeptide repeat protein [Anaerolineae bacterium]|nr:tetratricopeptide repeat protein [Anaerolineae bacterium]MCB9131277.1 tetratricopeptide repeat protein [Anaerolineales bacterium]MCB0229562.1 tetratricopeptide repeat protein [Anaerolineae bacterium]MCB0233379.1 tetratricopeptide repeat protein [Anaerolineae bacterium]MCB0247196.1 tetratricopeptide repeat protein [Anaerolineae bacterium]
MSQETASLPTDYSDLFRSHIVRSVARSASRLEAGEGLPAADERNQALHTLSYALDLEEIWPETRALLLALAPRMEQAGHRDDWIPYLSQGVQQSHRLDDISAEAALRWHLGVILELQSRFADAREQLELSAAQFAACADNRNQARALNRLALIARLQRQPVEASSLVDHTLELLEPEDTERAYCYIIKGALALDARTWEDAATCFNTSIAILRPGDQRRMLAWSLSNLGAALRQKGDTAQAIACYEEAIAIFLEVEDPVHLASARMNLGNVYLKAGDPQRALEYYRAAEPVFRQVQETLRLASIYLNIGMACRELGMWVESERSMKTSIDLFAQLELPEDVANVREEMGRTYRAQGQTGEAAQQFEKALAILRDTPADPAWIRSIETQLSEIRAAAPADN